MAEILVNSIVAFRAEAGPAMKRLEYTVVTAVKVDLSRFARCFLLEWWKRSTRLRPAALRGPLQALMLKERTLMDFQAIAILILAWVPIAAGITWLFNVQSARSSSRDKP